MLIVGVVKRNTYTIMPYKTVIHLLGVARNPANGFPARLLALRSIENGYGAYFVRAYDLVEDLRKAQAEHRLDRRMRVYPAPKVLIIDEFRHMALRPRRRHRLLQPGLGQV